MAPNRKSLSALAQSFDVLDLVNTLPTKYFLPLTHPSEASSRNDQEDIASAAAALASQQDSFSYWEWSSDDCILEPTVCVLSSDNIVSNLIQAGNALGVEEDRCGGDVNHEHDDYWSEGPQPLHMYTLRYDSSARQEPSACEVDTLGSDSYWGWESSPCSRVAELVMATHPALQQERRQQQQRQEMKHVVDATLSSYDYWAW
jgi:hypothetical protein